MVIFLSGHADGSFGTKAYGQSSSQVKIFMELINNVDLLVVIGNLDNSISSLRNVNCAF